MLHKADKLRDFTLVATDGEIGKVKDLYFDDRHWTVRYLVADTGTWLEQKLVLVSPYAVTSLDEEKKRVVTNLARKQIEESPSADSEMPVSRQLEIQYAQFYQWPVYWYGPYAWGAYTVPRMDDEDLRVPRDEDAAWDSHLRSVEELTDYTVAATDGDIGHIADFLVDDEDWAIRYLVVDTHDWLPGKHVLVSPSWIREIRWDGTKVLVDLSRDTIEESPEYTDDTQVTRDYEAELCRHYGREGYWDEACGLESEELGVPVGAARGSAAQATDEGTLADTPGEDLADL